MSNGCSCLILFIQIGLNYLIVNLSKPKDSQELIVCTKINFCIPLINN